MADVDVALSELRISSEAIFPPTTINEIGADLLVEILIRLPNPRFACRSKLVCKRWSSLISSPRFNRRFVSHRQIMNQNQAPMPDDPYDLKSVILSFLPPMPREVGDALRVLDCNRDLVLCGFFDEDGDNWEQSRSYLVCNPFTKQWVALPVAPTKPEDYTSPTGRLVCEPRISHKLDLGDGQAFVHSEYRFRVVCVYGVWVPNMATKLDVFCSESGEWTEEALVCDDQVRTGAKSVVSCNGELFWHYADQKRNWSYNRVAVFNPFRLDMPPTFVEAPAFPEKPHWVVSGSQGVLHVIATENETVPVRVSVWRLEEDRKSWRKQCERMVNKTSECCSYEVEGCYRPFLHPHKPEIVFFNPVPSKEKNDIMRLDLRREELECFEIVEGEPDVLHLQVFQPRTSCWATPIPRYEELRCMYDGSYSFWDQSSNEAETPSLTR